MGTARLLRIIKAKATVWVLDAAAHTVCQVLAPALPRGNGVKQLGFSEVQFLLQGQLGESEEVEWTGFGEAPGRGDLEGTHRLFSHPWQPDLCPSEMCW